MNAFRDYADKSYLTSRNVRAADESRLEITFAVIGIVSMIVLVCGMLALPAIIR